MTDVSEELFETVAKIVGDKSVTPKKKSSMAEKCKFYGLYKQATVGRLDPPYGEGDKDVDSRPKSRPGILQFEARSKYDGWKECEEMTKQEAMNAYVKLAEETVGQPVSDAIGAAK